MNTEVGKETATARYELGHKSGEYRGWEGGGRSSGRLCGGWVIREIVGRLGHQGDCGEVGSSGRLRGGWVIKEAIRSVLIERRPDTNADHVRRNLVSPAISYLLTISSIKRSTRRDRGRNQEERSP